MNEADAQPRPFHINIDRELSHPQVIALLEEHLAGMRAASPPECVFALDLEGLRRPEITFLTAWRPAPSDSPDDEGDLLAMGALKELTPTTATEGGHGELKSMRTSTRHQRHGAAQVILTERLNLARQRGCVRVSPETGSTPAFDPAMAAVPAVWVYGLRAVCGLPRRSVWPGNDIGPRTKMTERHKQPKRKVEKQKARPDPESTLAKKYT